MIETFNLVWYASPKMATEILPLNKCFTDIQVGSFRSEWANPKATFIGFKGGFNQADHGHLDIGSFVLEMKGVRWAKDFGRDSYDLPDYFNRTEGGGRWKYFRLNTKSHNTLVLNNDIQRATAKAPILSWETKGNDSMVRLDLSEAYTPHAYSVIRTIKNIRNAEIVIADRIEWANGLKRVQWQMLTDADISLTGNQAELLKDGEQIVATILQPQGAVFEVITAEQAAPEMNNLGSKLLLVQLTEIGNSTEIEISIEYHWPRGPLCNGTCHQSC